MPPRTCTSRSRRAGSSSSGSKPPRARLAPNGRTSTRDADAGVGVGVGVGGCGGPNASVGSSAGANRDAEGAARAPDSPGGERGARSAPCTACAPRRRGRWDVPRRTGTVIVAARSGTGLARAVIVPFHSARRDPAPATPPLWICLRVSPDVAACERRPKDGIAWWCNWRSPRPRPGDHPHSLNTDKGVHD